MTRVDPLLEIQCGLKIEMAHIDSRYENYTKHDLYCHHFSSSCSILTVNRGIVLPTLYVNSQHYLSFLINLLRGGIMDLQC